MKKINYEWWGWIVNGENEFKWRKCIMNGEWIVNKENELWMEIMNCEWREWIINIENELWMDRMNCE